MSFFGTNRRALNEVQAMFTTYARTFIQAPMEHLLPKIVKPFKMKSIQLKEEITKTADLTEFNKIKLLNGEIDRRSFFK